MSQALALNNINDARKKIERLERENEKEKRGKHTILVGGLSTGFGALIAFGLGIWRTRRDADKQDAFGVPSPLVVAGIGTIGGIWADNAASPFLFEMAKAGVYGFFGEVGRGVGREMRHKKGLPPVSMQGDGASAGGTNLDDDRLLAMARRRAA